MQSTPETDFMARPSVGFDDPRLYANVRTNRIFAFLIDAVLIIALTALAGLLVGVLGIFTFGLGWLLMPILWPAVALAYVAFTLGGANSATPGMRTMGLTMRMVSGKRPDVLIAGMHALLSWFSITIPVLLLATFFNGEKRLLHDILLGTVVINRDSGMN